MHTFLLFASDSAPAASRPTLVALQESFGFLPNIAAVMAGSPVLINGFIGVFQNVHAGSFTEEQIQVLLLTNAVTNGCAWAIAFHTALALDAGLELVDTEALRQGRMPSDVRDAALSNLAKRLIQQRGHVEDADIQQFLDAGFEQQHVLEVIAVVAASTMTNYAGSIGNPPLEKMIEAHAWTA